MLKKCAIILSAYVISLYLFERIYLMDELFTNYDDLPDDEYYIFDEGIYIDEDIPSDY